MDKLGRLEVEQLKVTSTTPPADSGFYKIDETTMGVVGDLKFRHPKTGAMSSALTVASTSAQGVGKVKAGDQPADVVVRRASLKAPVLQLIGDSRMRQAYVISTPRAGYNAATIRTTNIGFVSHFLAISKRRFSKVVFCARSGRKVRDLVYEDSGFAIDSISKSVIAPAATHVLILLGYNDLFENYNSDQVFNWVSTIAATAQAEGKEVAILADMPPMADGAWIASKQREMLKYNRMLKNAAAQGRFDVIQTDDIVVDYAVTNAYQAKSGSYQDLIHPNAATARKIALRVDAYYAVKLPQTFRYWASHPIDNIVSDPTNSNLIVNGEFNGTTGWTIGSGGVISSITQAVIDAPDGSGKALAIDITTSGAGNVNLSSCDRTAFTPAGGDSVFLSASVWVQGSGGTGNPSGIVTPYLRMDITTDSTDDGRHAAMYPTATTGEVAITDQQDLLLETLPYYYTGSEIQLSTKVYLAARFAAAGSARIIFAHVAVLKNQPVYAPDGWHVV